MKSTYIILCLATTLFALFEGVKWSKLTSGKRILTILSAAVAISTAIVCYQDEKKQELRDQREALVWHIESKFGDITPKASDVLLPELCVRNTGTCFILKNGTMTFEQTGRLFKLYVKDRKLFINVVIRDRDGIPIAAIDSNTWTMYDYNYEYNSDDAAFELITRGDRRVIFQIEFTGGRAYVAGLLFNKNGYGINFFAANLKRKGLDGAAMIFLNPSISDVDSLTDVGTPRLFRYPREKYDHMRAK